MTHTIFPLFVIRFSLTLSLTHSLTHSHTHCLSPSLFLLRSPKLPPPPLSHTNTLSPTFSFSRQMLSVICILRGWRKVLRVENRETKYLDFLRKINKRKSFDLSEKTKSEPLISSSGLFRVKAIELQISRICVLSLRLNIRVSFEPGLIRICAK